MRNPARALLGARVYLSGPMDFVGSRDEERRFGWRSRITRFLDGLGVTVFDPWNKPTVRWFYEYGRETVHLTKIRSTWSFDASHKGIKCRASCASMFRDTMHIDLRMVDISDFIIAYCPTNIYSVGTVHEIVMASHQHKPVLFVSPRFNFGSLSALEGHLRHDKVGIGLLNKLKDEIPIKPNPEGVPSLWYMSLLGGHSFFDGFGFAGYTGHRKWQKSPLDEREKRLRPRRPLLPFLEKLNSGALPKRYNGTTQKFSADDDWLLLEIKRSEKAKGLRK